MSCKLFIKYIILKKIHLALTSENPFNYCLKFFEYYVNVLSKFEQNAILTSFIFPCIENNLRLIILALKLFYNIYINKNAVYLCPWRRHLLYMYQADFPVFSFIHIQSAHLLTLKYHLFLTGNMLQTFILWQLSKWQRS